MRRALSAGACGQLLVLVLGCGPEPAPVAPAPSPAGEPQTDLIDLRPGLCLDYGEVTGGSVHRYRFALAAGEYLHLAVEQIGVDLTATVLGPDEERLLEVDSPTGTRGVEEVFLLAPTLDELALELRAWEGAEPGNRFQVRVEALRPATREDRASAAAARAYSDARRLRKDGFSEQAAERYEEAASLWREAGEQGHLATTLFNLGTLLAAEARPRAASVELLQQALGLYRQLGDRRQAALTLAEMGDALLQLDAWQRARRSYEASLALWRELGEPKQEAHTLNDLGVVARRQGQLRQALEYYRRALEIWRRLGLRREEAITLGNLGTFYALLGESRQAHDHLHQSLELLDPERAPERRAVTLTKLGDALLSLGSPETALEKYREALDLRRQSGDRAGEAVTLNSIGRLYQRRGEPGLALEAFRAALAILRDHGEAADRSMVLDNFGIFYEELGQDGRARELFVEALDLARSVSYRQVEAAALFGLARLTRRQNRLGEARELIEEAIEVVESIRAESAGRQDLQSSFLATKQGYYDFLVELLAEMHRRDPGAEHDAAAFAASERARARGLLDALAEVRNQALQGAEDLRRLAELREEVSLRHQERLQLAGDGAEEEDVRRLGLELRTLLDDLHEAEARIRRRRPHWPGLDEPLLLSLEQVRGELDEETLLLKYHVTGERALLWAVGAEGAVLFDLGAGRDVRESARRAYEALAESHRSTETPRARLAAADLSRRALAPAAPLLGRRRLLIVATDALQYVPFAALPKPGSAGEVDAGASPLVVDHEIVHLPSASFLGVERASRSPPGRLAVLADPVVAPGDERLRGLADGATDRGLPRLRFSRQEADAILELAGGDGTLAAIGFAADRELVLSGRLDDFRILHFATHGIVDAEHPELSALVTSRYRSDGKEVDGYLRAFEIFNLDLAADLVVLSACRTALGKEVRGEGLVGLTRAFMDAGAAQVVVSLWSVNDRATAQLMADFYRGLLAERLPPGRALQAAQASMWRDARWRAPYYWAGFVLTGDPAPRS